MPNIVHSGCLMKDAHSGGTWQPGGEGYCLGMAGGLRPDSLETFEWTFYNGIFCVYHTCQLKIGQDHRNNIPSIL